MNTLKMGKYKSKENSPIGKDRGVVALMPDRKVNFPIGEKMEK